MRRWIILGVLLVIATIAGWQYIVHVKEVEEKKEELWHKMTDGESLTLAECLKHQYHLIAKCMEIEAAVDKAIGR